MLGFDVVGYVFKKISIPLAPFTLALVLGNRAEDAFPLSMIGASGDMTVFWSNGLVGSITTLAILLLPRPSPTFLTHLRRASTPSPPRPLHRRSTPASPTTSCGLA
jgi:TctA family transporter